MSDIYTTPTSAYDLPEWYRYDGAAYYFYDEEGIAHRKFTHAAPCSLRHIWRTVSLDPHRNTCLRPMCLAAPALYTRLRDNSPDLYFRMKGWHLAILQEGYTTYLLKAPAVDTVRVTEEPEKARDLTLSETITIIGTLRLKRELPDRLFFATPNSALLASMLKVGNEVSDGKILI